MLRDEVEQYTNLTGEDGWHIPIIKVGAYLDGYNKGLEQRLKKGQWIERFDESGKWYECDQCHTDWGGAVNFCPNCGAKMYR